MPNQILDRDQANNLLSTLTGEWQGTNRTWFEPGVLADESPIHGRFRQLPGSQYLLYDYESSLEAKPFQGLAFIGYNIFTMQFEMAWGDAFHQSTNLMFARGAGLLNSFSVFGSYVDPSGGPDWGWRTTFELLAPDRLTVTAFNIPPGGAETKAIEASYTRV